MKKIKNFTIVFLGILIIMLSTGCGNKTKISSKEFISTVEKQGFKVQDVKGQFSKYSYINKAYVAVDKSGKYQIEFYDLEDSEFAHKFFENNKKIFASKKVKASTKVESSMGNHEKYALTSNKKFMVVSRIDNTVIYVNVNSNYKSSVKDILDKLDY